MRYKTFAVDFDETITKNNPFPELGELREGADRVLRRIHDNGGKIAIWTCRGGAHEQKIKNYLASHNIPYDKFNEHFDEYVELFGQADSPKILADIYIDDKGVDTILAGGVDWNRIEGAIFGEVTDDEDLMEDHELIECSVCEEEKWVEKGTWALDRGMCSQCNCAYEGG